MKININHLCNGIRSTLITPESINYRPTTWPIPDDFPIVIDADGNIVSRYSDSVWKFWPWSNLPLSINFGDGKKHKTNKFLDKGNAAILRTIVAWWIYGNKPVRKASTVRARFKVIRRLFEVCHKHGILASDLVRFPTIAELLPDAFDNASRLEIISILHDLYDQHEQLGLILLDKRGIAKLQSSLTKHEKSQTPYIPARIWTYQVNRLHEFLEDFHKHKDNIVACYHFCLEAYANNAGSLEKACTVGNVDYPRPFANTTRNLKNNDSIYFGTFTQTAERFGIDALLNKWLGKPGISLEANGRGIKTLSQYFGMVGNVGNAYIMNFSLMRINEAWNLRTDCLLIENDDRFGNIYMLRGRTTKTLEDDDARWITSPSVKLAVDAMACVSKLRMICAEKNPDITVSSDDFNNPFLVTRPYEPWGNTPDNNNLLNSRPTYPDYGSMLSFYPKLFDIEQLRIIENDLNKARLITPTLDPIHFDIGLVWQLAWHQLRRTGAVNMQASGLVSEESLQYQLKQISRAMTLYYGRGYSHVHINDEAKNEYIRTMYEIIGKEMVGLFADRFVSPHGTTRKAQILDLATEADSKKLSNLAKLGKISFRETLLGGCTKSGPCEFGGIDNIVNCSGGNGAPACADAMFDKNKIDKIKNLGKFIDSRLVEAHQDSPLYIALSAQKNSVEYALNVLTK